MFVTRNLPRYVLALALFGAFGGLVLAGCSDDDNPSNPGGGTPTSSTFVGMFASGTESGRLSATINTTSLARRWNGHPAAKAIITATGTAVINGNTYNLIGTYDTVTNEIDIEGGGYSFTGTYQISAYGRPSITGDWSGPGGASDGGEFACYLGTSANVKAYCGVYRSIPSAPDSGSFSFTVIDTILTGVAHGSGESIGIFYAGTVTGSTNPKVITIDYVGGSAYTLFAPGTLDTITGAVAGTYDFADVAGGGVGDDNGTYAGDTCP